MEIVEDIWKTCCALHNMLLEDDGLDANWENGTKGDWEGEWGLHDRGDAAHFEAPRDFDSSQSGGVAQTTDVVLKMSLHKSTAACRSFFLEMGEG